MKNVLFSALAAASFSCIHPSTTGELYRAQGEFSLAAEYMAIGYEQDGRETASELSRTIELARSEYKEKLAAVEANEQYVDAFELVREWQDFEYWVESRRIDEISALDLKPVVRRLEEKAVNESLQRFDELSAEDVEHSILLPVLRQALALSPNDAELARRYERLKAALTRQTFISVQCPPSFGDLCRELRSLWVEELTKIRRELIFDIGLQNGRYDTRLNLILSDHISGQQWYRKEEGRREATVPVLNELREAVVDDDGNKVVRGIAANFQVWESWRRVEVQGAVVEENLRGASTGPKRYASSFSSQSQTQYIYWTGDERALVAEGLISKYGTSRRGPQSYENLRRQAAMKVLSAIFSQWIKGMES